MARRTAKPAKIDEVVDAFRLSGNADAAFDNLAARRLGVNPTDLQCLSIVQRRDGLTAGALAAEAGLTTGAVTGVVDRLERAGYARRVSDPDDRRRVKLEVTPKFYARADKIWGPVAADWAARLSGRFTADELERVIDFLRTTNELSREHLERLRGMKP